MKQLTFTLTTLVCPVGRFLKIHFDGRHDISCFIEVISHKKHRKDCETALWGKERFYSKKGFFQRKVLFKERFYSKKGFIQSPLLLSAMSAISAMSAMSA